MIFDFDPGQAGNRHAIRYRDRVIDYSVLRDQINRFAGGLDSLGIRKGDRVAVILKNSPEFVVSFFGLMKTGAIPVLLNRLSAEDELRFYFSDSMPSMVISDSTLEEAVSHARTQGMSGIPHILAGDYGDSRDCLRFSEVLSHGIPMEKGASLSPDDVALCQYSTGSTGRPKRVYRTHSHLSTEVEHFTRTVGVDKDDVLLAVVPLFHSHGLFNSMLASLYNSCTLVIRDEFIPREVLSTVKKDKVTIFPGVPFMFKVLSETYTEGDVDLSSLRLCFSAGAFLPVEVSKSFHKRFGVYVVQLYGTTETGSVSINLHNTGEPFLEGGLESVGRPMAGVHVAIFDEDGKVRPPGEAGEVGIKSSAGIKEYSGLVKETQEAFRDGYFFPGDIGKLDNEGRLYITGRKKLMINVSGNKVDPTEVENVLLTHGNIKEAVVIGIKDPGSGEIVKAVIVSDVPVSEGEIRNFCKRRLSEYKVPKVIEFRSEIPRSPLGKILRKYLQ